MRKAITAIVMAVLVSAGVGLAPIFAAPQDNTQKTATCTLQVSGMTCGGCTALVKSAAKKIDGVNDATVSYERKTAEVTYDPAKTNPEAIAKAITQKSGFKTSVPQGKKTNGR